MKSSLCLAKIFLLLTILSFSNLNLNAEKIDVKIGFVLPLSGEWSFLGNGIRDSALLAKEDLENKKYNYQLLFEDNHGELKNSATIGQHFINVKKVDALVSIISGVGILLNPMAEKAKVLNFSICSNTKAAKGRYNFLNYLTARQSVNKFIKEINSRYSNGINLSIFAMNESGFSFIVEELKKEANGSKIKFSTIENYQPGTTDFRSQISRAFRKSPDALLILGLSPEIEIIAKQLKEFGKNIPLVSIESFGLAENKKPFEGQWFVDAGVPNQIFRERFKKKFKRDITAGCGHAFDTVKMISDAYEISGDGKTKPTPDKVVKFLYNLKNYNGVLGGARIDSNGIVYTEPSIKLIVNGQSRLAS